MAVIYDEKVERVILELLHVHEAAKRAAERKLVAAQSAIAREDQAIAHLQFALEDYRKFCGLPSRRPNTPSPVLEAEYSHMGPTDLVQHWADNHGGEVMVKDLARVTINAGMYPNYRHAASTIYTVLKRKPFDKVGPGHFKRQESAAPVKDHGSVMPLPTATSFDGVDDLPL